MTTLESPPTALPATPPSAGTSSAGPAAAHGQPRRTALGLAVTVLVIVLTFAVGKGVASMSTHTHPGTTWLRTVPRGALTLVDGVTGRVSAGLTLPGTAGHELQVSQQGDVILVYDPATGVLTRINAGTLKAGTSRATVPGVVLVASDKAAFLVDYGAATAQRIDLATLAVSGPTIRLGGQLGQAGVDAQGTLWLPRIDTGQVIPVTNAVGVPVSVAHARSDLSVAIVGGRPTVVDGTDAKVSGLSTTGVTWSASLGTGPAQWTVPPTQDGSLLPLVNTTGHTLATVDTERHQIQSVPLGPAAPAQLGPPVAEGGRVFIPDYSDGQVLTYDSTAGSWQQSFPVTGHPGPFDAVAKDGVVYFNDPNGPKTIVVNGGGPPTPLDKYTPPEKHAAGTPPVPGAVPPPAQVVPILPSAGGQGAPTGGGNRQRRPRAPGLGSAPAQPQPTPSATTPSASPSSSASPPPAGPPLAPVNVQAVPQSGGAGVSWSEPAGGGPVASFVIAAQPGGAQQTATGTSRTATFTGLNCATAYQFAVTAVGTGGQQVSSAPSAAVHPCTTPAAPTGIGANGRSDGSIAVRWDPQPGSSFEVAYSGPTSGRLRTQNTSITIPAGSLTYLGQYTISVYATNAAGTSPAATASASAGPPGQSFSVDVSLSRTDPVNPCINVPTCRATVNAGPSHTTAVVGYAPQGSTVTGYCHKAGQTIRNDRGASSAEWIYITDRGTGYVPSIWLGGPGAYQSVPPCP